MSSFVWSPCSTRVTELPLNLVSRLCVVYLLTQWCQKDDIHCNIFLLLVYIPIISFWLFCKCGREGLSSLWKTGYLDLKWIGIERNMKNSNVLNIVFGSSEWEHWNILILSVFYMPLVTCGIQPWLWRKGIWVNTDVENKYLPFIPALRTVLCFRARGEFGLRGIMIV